MLFGIYLPNSSDISRGSEHAFSVFRRFCQFESSYRIVDNRGGGQNRVGSELQEERDATKALIGVCVKCKQSMP